MARGVNYVPNPSFSTGSTSGWSATNATSFVLSSTVAQPGSGPYAAVVTANGSGPCSAVVTVPGLITGSRYAASVYVYCPSVAGSLSITPVSSAGVSGWSTRGQVDRWVRIRVTFTAEATTETLTFTTSSTPPAGSIFYIDRASVVMGELPGPYFDGDYPYCIWNGSAGSSASTCPPLTNFNPTSEEAVMAGQLVLDTVAWNISSKTGRFTIPNVRGANTSVPGQSGKTFVKNKPVDTGLWTLQMWVLGTNSDGTVPQFGDMRRVFSQNLARLEQALTKTHEPVTLTTWQSDGTVRQTIAQLAGQSDGNLVAGGTRGQYSMVFEILNGSWSDYIKLLTLGTPGSHWSSDTLSLPGLAGGTAPIEDAVVSVYGPFTNPLIQSASSGVGFALNDSLASGEVWTVDSGAWTSTKNGVSNLANLTHFGHPRFLVIPAGELLASPSIQVSGTGTGTTTNVSVTAARKHWSG